MVKLNSGKMKIYPFQGTVGLGSHGQPMVKKNRCQSQYFTDTWLPTQIPTIQVDRVVHMPRPWCFAAFKVGLQSLTNGTACQTHCTRLHCGTVTLQDYTGLSNALWTFIWIRLLFRHRNCARALTYMILPSANIAPLQQWTVPWHPHIQSRAMLPAAGLM